MHGRRAINCKTARGRAGEAIRQLKTRKTLGRSFDDCFEMGDGTAVVRIVIARANADKDLANIVRERGFGNWLEAGYLPNA